MQYQVTFSKQDPQKFYIILQKRVNAYFKDNKIQKTGNISMYLKTLFMFSLYLIPYTLILLQIFESEFIFLLYILMGFGAAGIGLSVMHDANHGAYSSKKWLNEFMTYSINVIGHTSYTWKVQHNLLHHTYTNIYSLDEDIDDKPFLKLSPHGITKPYHRYQHLYAPFLYALATLVWFLIKELKQFLSYIKSNLLVRVEPNLTKATIIFILTKVLYITYVIIIPIVVGIHWAWAIAGFVIMQAVIGLTLTLIFQMAHAIEDLEHYKPVMNGTMENTWAIHQINTTANFACDNRLLTWYVGGLNFQVEHHLFPNICHIHYPALSKIVKATTEELGLPYHEHSTFGKALSSHFRMLKKNGRYDKYQETKKASLVG